MLIQLCMVWNVRKYENSFLGSVVGCVPISWFARSLGPFEIGKSSSFLSLKCSLWYIVIVIALSPSDKIFIISFMVVHNIEKSGPEQCDSHFNLTFYGDWWRWWSWSSSIRLPVTEYEGKFSNGFYSLPMSLLVGVLFSRSSSSSLLCSAQLSATSIATNYVNIYTYISTWNRLAVRRRY